MSKFVRVMDGLKSNAGGFVYKLDEVNVADKWNPKASTPEEMGGFNFGVEDKILRWSHRGDTIYDVIITDDADVILVNEEKGIYRSNKIIVSNPRFLTDDLLIDLYKKNTLSDKVLAEVLVVLLFRERTKVAEYIVNDKVNKDNVDYILNVFANYAGEENLKYDIFKNLYNLIKSKK